MSPTPSCHGIIPARYASSRFPGKPLADILGKPMFWHVWSRARQCPELASVTLATDDERIRIAAEGLGVPCVMTATEHQSGTDRVYEATSKLAVPEEAVVVNIQGDEPLLAPAMLSELVRPFASPGVRVATLAMDISPAEGADPNRVKVVLARNGDALYFSRAPIPFFREGAAARLLGHIGLYAFRMEALRAFTALPLSRLEQTEKLEQLRLLENNIPIRVSLTTLHSLGVDRPEDLQNVIKLLKSS